MQPLRRWHRLHTSGNPSRANLPTAHASSCTRLHSPLRTAALQRRTLLGLAPAACCGRHGRLDWYDRYFAFNMAHGMEDYEAQIAPIKAALFERLFMTNAPGGTPVAGIQGSSAHPTQVLELGIGTSPNLPFMVQQQQNLTITGVDPNKAMWPYAEGAAASVGLAPQQLQLVDADATALPFDDGSFDVAVVTLVLCSLPSPQAALRELHRVLRPGGRLLTIEHVAAAPGQGWLRAQQALLDPLQQLLADRCHLTRDTGALLLRSGFEAAQGEPPALLTAGCVNDAVAALQGGQVRGLVGFSVDGMGLIAPHVAGLLQRPLTVAAASD